LSQKGFISMHHNTSKSQPRQNGWAIYLLPNTQEETLLQAQHELASYSPSVLFLSLDPNSKSSGSDGSKRYNVCYMIDGTWVLENNKDEKSTSKRKMRSIHFDLCKVHLIPLPENKNIQLISSKTQNYQNILNAALSYGGIRSLSQIEQLPDVVHKHGIAPDLDIKSVVVMKLGSRRLYGLYKPEDLKHTVEKLLEHAVLATAYDIQQIKKILDAALKAKPPNLNYLHELLSTPGTVKDPRGRTHKDRVLAQIFIGMKSVNVDSEKGNRVIHGLEEWIYENYYKPLPDGTKLWAQHYNGQLPKGYEEAEALRVANESRELNKMVAMVAENKALCQQTMALDSFHGCDLRNIALTNNDENQILASAIYLEAGAEGLACSFRALSGEVATKLLPWDRLGNFPHDVNKMINPPYQLSPVPNVVPRLDSKIEDQYVALEKEKLYVSYDKKKQVLCCAALNIEGVEIGWQIKLSDLMKRLGEDDWPRLEKALEGGDLNQLNAFLPIILAISSERNLTLSKQTYLPILLAQLAEPGQFYTEEQRERLKQLSDTTIKAVSPKAYNKAWDELQKYIKDIVGVTTDLTLLKALYEHRNHSEPKGDYTTGHHANLHLFKEFCELYDRNFQPFGGNWFSPGNVFCVQKIGGLTQSAQTAEELQMFAQGPFDVLVHGHKLKRVFSYRLGGGSIFPFSDPSLSILSNCAAWRDGAFVWGAECGVALLWPWARLVGLLISSKNISAAKIMLRPGNLSDRGCAIM